MCGHDLPVDFFVGFNAFLAFYWMSRWSVSASTGAIILAVFLGFGVGGTLLGGWLADRYGRRAMLCSGFGTAAVLLPLLLAMTDLVPATLFLVLLGIAFYVPSSVLVVLGQAYLPHRVGVASGVTLGLGVSMGGMVAPLLGKVADHHGVQKPCYWFWKRFSPSPCCWRWRCPDRPGFLKSQLVGNVARI